MEEGQLGEKALLECQRKSKGYDGFMTAAESAAGSLALKCNKPLNQYEGNRALTPSWYDVDDLVPAYRALFDVDGKIAAMPFAGETVFLMYRKDLLEAAGKPVPKTWDELRDTARALDTDGVDGITFRAASGWEFTYEWSVFLFPFGGRIIDPETGRAALDGPGSVAALEYMKSLKPYAPQGIESFSFAEAWAAMQTGRAAMAVEASAAGPQMEDPKKSAVAGKLGYAPLPAGPAGAYSGAWAWGLGINNYSEHPGAMWALIAYLTGKPTHKRYVDLGGPATRTSVLRDPAYRRKYPYFKATEQALAQAANLAEKGLGVVPKTPAWFQMSDVIGREGSKAFVGQQSSQEAVAKMQRQVARILAKSAG
jgi:ABC-type glycerol-3-phosphate transport system substrate-binding protein